MNERGQYGEATRTGSLRGLPLRGGSLRGSWARGGHHSFHGEEAPIYGSCGYRVHNLAVGSPRARAYGPRVGVHWTLSPIADRTQIVDQITSETNSLYNELLREMGVDPFALDPSMVVKDPARFMQAQAAKEKSPLYPIWRDVFSPFLKKWNEFHRGYSEWSEFFHLTDWDKLKSFADQWHAIYDRVSEAIHAHGGKLLAPPPAKIPDDVVDRIEDFLKSAAGKAGGALGDVWSAAKIALYGGLAIGGVFLIATIAKDMRSPT